MRKKQPAIRSIHAVIAALALSVITHAASADVINVAFHQNSTTASAMATRPAGSLVDTSVDKWNNPTAAGALTGTFSGYDLYDSANVDSGADLAASTAFANTSANGYESASQDYVMMAGWYGLGTLPAGSEYISVTNLPAVFTDGGYTVIIYGDAGVARTMDYTIGSTTKTIVGTGAFGGTFIEGVNMVTFTGLTDSSFVIYGESVSGDPRSAVSGFQIISGVVPTPAAFSLGIVLLGFAVSRRR